MKRILYYSCLIFSSLLFAMLLTLCIRGHFRWDSVTWRDVGQASWCEVRFSSYGGIIQVDTQTIWFDGHVPAQEVGRHSPSDEGVIYWSVGHGRADWVFESDRNPFSISWESHSRGDGSTHTVRVDYGVPLVVTAILPIWWILRMRHRRRCRRVARGHCSTCNYDLRGLSSGRCPECGASASAPAATSDDGQSEELSRSPR